MNLGEMFKMLQENKKLKFEAIHPKYKDKFEFSVVNGFLKFKRWSPMGELIDDPNFNCINGNIQMDYDWQLVRQPVPWQEAIQAWLDGKEIEICECAGCGENTRCERCKAKRKQNIFTYGDASCQLSDICYMQFETAKWYINE